MPKKVTFKELTLLLNQQGYKIFVRNDDQLENLKDTFLLIGGDRFHKGNRENLWKTLDSYELTKKDRPEGQKFAESLKTESNLVSRYLFKPVKRCVMVIDVVEFTERPMDEQCLVISALHQIITQIEGETRPELVEMRLTTGDGFAFVFKGVENACLYAACLAGFLEKFNQKAQWGDIHFRIGIDYGNIHYIKDFSDHWNCVGDAVNDASRVLSTIGKDMDDVIYVSHNVFKKSNRYFKELMIPMGRRKAKHNRMYRVYHLNLYGVLNNLQSIPTENQEFFDQTAINPYIEFG